MYFSKLNNPKQLRKNILLGAKESLLMLSKQKQIEDLKAEKDQSIQDLSEIVQDINKEIKKLDAMLPNKELKKEAMKRIHHTHTEVHHRVHHAKTKKTTTKSSSTSKFSKSSISDVQAPKQPTITDMDRLEYTLKKIEDKLASLN